MISYKEFEKLDKTEIEILYLELSKALIENNFVRFAGRQSSDRMIREAKAWIMTNKEKLCQLLCENENILKFCKDNKAINRYTIFATIVDLISSAFSILPIANLAVLIMREFLDTLCTSKINQENPKALK